MFGYQVSLPWNFRRLLQNNLNYFQILIVGPSYVNYKPKFLDFSWEKKEVLNGYWLLTNRKWGFEEWDCLNMKAATERWHLVNVFNDEKKIELRR